MLARDAKVGVIKAESGSALRRQSYWELMVLGRRYIAGRSGLDLLLALLAGQV